MLLIIGSPEEGIDIYVHGVKYKLGDGVVEDSNLNPTKGSEKLCYAEKGRNLPTPQQKTR